MFKAKNTNFINMLHTAHIIKMTTFSDFIKLGCDSLKLLLTLMLVSPSFPLWKYREREETAERSRVSLHPFVILCSGKEILLYIPFP